MFWAKQRGVPVVLNAAPAASGKDLADLLAMTDILVVNETEAEVITGQKAEDFESLVLALTEEVPTVVMTLGAKGAAYGVRGSTEVVKCPAIVDNIKVVDTTGAGDAFVGAFMYFRFCYGLSMKESIQNACRIASITVQSEGTQSSYPVRAQLPKDLFPATQH